MFLNNHTYFSLCFGTMNVAELIQLLADNHCEQLVLTDINSTSACIDFVRQCNNRGLKPIIGIDFRVGVQQRFIAIAKNNEGFQELNQYLSELLHAEVDCPEIAPNFKHAYIIYPFEKGRNYSLRDFEFIGVRTTDLPFIRLKNWSTEKAVVLNTVTFRTKKDFNAHRLLRAIDKNVLLSKLPLSEQGKESDQLIPIKELVAEFVDFPEIIANTQHILNTAEIQFDFSPERSENLQTYTSSRKEDWKLLKRLCAEGLAYRYPEMTLDIELRIKKELKAIKEMNFVAYFLINWDIVSYARSKGYFYVGRGSGANSVIAYILRITDVDPIELDLYFERFINAFRSSPPDFDIDFSWTDRDDVTRYIFERFPNTALVATYNTFKDRAVTRELGKVFGLPKEEIDKMVKATVQPWEFNEFSRLILKYGEYIRDFPSHLSIHASGIVISERPINYFSATFMPPKGYPTIQFDMHVAEDMGWYKFDILSQRGLSKIKDTMEIIRYNQPDSEAFDIHDIQRFKEDEQIKKMLRNADAIGCFYVESPAMRMLLRKLQVDNYIGLVAASSVIRPGVAKSGMMNAYIQRFRHPEKRADAHPVLLELMPETFGVMVYQEDVIKVAHYFAGLTLGEADKMRRGMSGKFRSRDEFLAVKQQFFDNCIKKGHSPEVTAEVWRQTESFAGYAFAKGHSASYAVESYQCLFLKAYFPLEFLVATINNYGGFYTTELYVLEAKRLGATIEPICINNSRMETCIIGTTIYLGFHLLASFETKVGKRIVEAKRREGAFVDLDDFLERVPISIEQISLLIRVNAFRFTGRDKRQLLWEIQLKIAPKKEVAMADLFRLKPKEFQLPELKDSWQEDVFDQLELFGFSLYDRFSFALPDQYKGVLAKDLPRFAGQKVWIKGYLIHVKKTVTSNGDLMFFGIFLDEEGAWLDSVHFPNIARRYLFRGRGVYVVFGRVNLEYDCVTIEAEYLEKIGVIEDPRYAEKSEK